MNVDDQLRLIRGELGTIAKGLANLNNNIVYTNSRYNNDDDDDDDDDWEDDDDDDDVSPRRSRKTQISDSFLEEIDDKLYHISEKADDISEKLDTLDSLDEWMGRLDATLKVLIDNMVMKMSVIIQILKENQQLMKQTGAIPSGNEKSYAEKKPDGIKESSPKMEDSGIQIPEMPENSVFKNW